MSEHAKTLEPKIRALQEGLKKITSENNTEQLLLIIHRPGFTTPQEAEFVHAMLVMCLLNNSDTQTQSVSQGIDGWKCHYYLRDTRLDSLAHQIEGVGRAHRALVAAADKIGRE